MQPSSDPWPPDPESSPLDGGVPVKITKEINLAQLQAEVVTALNLEPGELNMTLAGAADPSAPVDDDNFETLWITPPSVDVDTVEQVVADHEPDPEFGVTEQQKTFATAMAKITEDPDADLSDDEIRSLAVGAALRSQVH